MIKDEQDDVVQIVKESCDELLDYIVLFVDALLQISDLVGVVVPIHEVNQLEVGAVAEEEVEHCKHVLLRPLHLMQRHAYQVHSH